MKAAVAVEAGVPASAVKHFTLTSTLVAARRSLQAKSLTGVADHTAGHPAAAQPQPPKLRQLAAYAWTVSCDISAPLSSTAFASEEALSTAVQQPLSPLPEWGASLARWSALLSCAVAHLGGTLLCVLLGR